MHVLQVIRHRAGASASMVRRCALLALIGFYAATSAHAASLDPAVLPKIQAATFEVVAAKPLNDPLTYEKPLPLELLPFQERNDKYFSIGTAFAIGNNRYVTAGHVLQVGIGSLWGPPALRDASGNVYAIDKIEKYSLQEDFVVFSLVKPPANAAALEVNTSPSLNAVVYAVGNALGTGVVIRDGLYTSDTPEDQDGRWKWMRFSAAASPGNSGGPLLDKDGKLIGIVLMKSANENLNYALPIGLILKAPDHLAVMDQRVPYQLDIFDTTQNNILKDQFALPLSFADFSAAYTKRFNAYTDTQIKLLLGKDADKLFPRGDGSSRILHSAARQSGFPGLIVRSTTGDWEVIGKSSKKIPLSDNGYVTAGVAKSNILFHLRKPDNLAASALYGNPVMLMDQLAKVGIFQRRVGSEEIKITSLGKPATDTVHVDAWQRRWQVRIWDMPYMNVRVVTFSLPVPDGYVTMMRFAPGGHDYDSVADMNVLTDFIDVAYGGTLAQWKDYQKNTALLPTPLRGVALDVDYGKRFSYRTHRLNFSFVPSLQKIEQDSLLMLGFGFFDDHGKVVWDVGDVQVFANANDPDQINIQRHVAPSADLDDDFKSEWNKLTHQHHPYDSVAQSDNGEMQIATTAGATGNATPSVLYSVGVAVDGTQPQPAMKAKLDGLMQNLHVDDH
ncbi:S1-C subfamily serine protease [Rhodanobacter sp. K2T2]|uniref:S1 family peptidase n=1 Tax=Rhodanobacter sp. K2T2 TaxID=2723085 RepID=UPI00185EFF5A|nr:trypsin-like peptidase domain-containing protein [Rhodanobacter sp. K2T2]NYE29065.1 S1-C subfamily serine protease [Rhodanobacter sp. K2T2]